MSLVFQATNVQFSGPDSNAPGLCRHLQDLEQCMPFNMGCYLRVGEKIVVSDRWLTVIAVSSLNTRVVVMGSDSSVGLFDG